MEDLEFVTCRYMGEDWNQNPTAGNLFLYLDPVKYPNQVDTIKFPYPVDPHGVVLGVRSFYLDRKRDGTTGQISWGIEAPPTVDNSDPSGGTVTFKPRLSAHGVLGTADVPINPRTVVLELSLIAQRLSA